MVQIEALDGYCCTQGIETIDFLKLDVEGHELDVLKGSIEMIEGRKIKTIQLEYGGANIDAGTLLKDFFELFHGRPYRMHKIYPEKLQHVQRYDQRLENFKYQNWAVILDV